MIAGGLIVLKYLGLGIAGLLGMAFIVIMSAPFALSSRISREEEAEEYRRLLADLKRVQAQKCAEATANDHGAPLDLVRP